MAIREASPNMPNMHHLDRCRAISSRELEEIFCTITLKLFASPLVESPHSLVRELANTIEVRLGGFCLTDIDELIMDRYQCDRYHVDQQDLVNHIFDVILSLERNNIL